MFIKKVGCPNRNRFEPGMRFALICCMFSALFLFSFSNTNTELGDEITMKAVFMERFTRFIEWPDDLKSPDADSVFTILFLGDHPSGNIMEQLFATTTIKGHEIRVLYSQNIQDIALCQMVYISSSMQKYLNRIIMQIRMHPVLSIGDTFGFADKGVMINFVLEKDVLRFEINLNELKKSPLVCSSSLLKLAKIVE